MLIGRPDLDLRRWKGSGQSRGLPAGPLFKAAYSSTLAATWRGRGWRRRAPRRLPVVPAALDRHRASQPRAHPLRYRARRPQLAFSVRAAGWRDPASA